MRKMAKKSDRAGMRSEDNGQTRGEDEGASQRWSSPFTFMIGRRKGDNKGQGESDGPLKTFYHKFSRI